MKVAVASVLHGSGLDRVIGAVAGSTNGPAVFGYHRVVDDFRAYASATIPAMLIGLGMFERQVDWISRRFRVVSLDELRARLESGADGAERTAVITFDDGYREIYEHAFPLLVRKGIPAGIFVVTDHLGTSRLHLHDKLYLLISRAFDVWRSPTADLRHALHRLGIEWPDGNPSVALPDTPLGAMRRLFTALPQSQLHRVIEALEATLGIDEGAARESQGLTWDMLIEMHRKGMTIGSHTKTHALLTNECLETVREEVTGSRLALEQRLGAPIDYFAYPDGRFSRSTVRAVAAAGYRLAVTTCRHQDPDYPALTVPRRLFWEKSAVDAHERFCPAVVSCEVHGVFDMLSRCEQDHGAAIAVGEREHVARARWSQSS